MKWAFYVLIDFCFLSIYNSLIIIIFRIKLIDYFSKNMVGFSSLYYNFMLSKLNILKNENTTVPLRFEISK